MFTSSSNGFVRNSVCFALALAIVTATLAIGALGVELVASGQPVVTITQLA